MSENDDFLGVTDAAAFMSVSTMTIKRWIKSGYLPSILVGNRRRIKISDLEEIRSGRKPK